MQEPRAESVRLHPWEREDLLLLRRMNSPAMWAHLGEPEDENQVLARHYRYLESVRGETRMFTIRVGGEKAGNIGYWIRPLGDAAVLETGWMVLPEFQGRGIATEAALRLIAVLREDVGSGVVHAYPSVSHPASNAVCRKAGFTRLGPVELEFPAGRLMWVNDWIHPL